MLGKQTQEKSAFGKKWAVKLLLACGLLVAGWWSQVSVPVTVEDDADASYLDIEIKDNSSPFDELTQICSHNAFNYFELFASTASTTSLLQNQHMNIQEQLDAGVRSLMLDIFAADDGLVMCHGPECLLGGVRHFNFEDTMDLIVAYVRTHPTETMTLILENADGVPVSTQQLQAGFDKMKENIAEYAFDFDAWSAIEKSAPHWPTVNQMLARKQQLVIMHQEPGILVATCSKNGKAFSVLSQFDFTVENQYSETSTTQCERREKPDENQYQKTVPGTQWPRLFVMNQFPYLPIPLYGLPTTHNRFDTLFDKYWGACEPKAKVPPNFVTLDFVN